MEDSMNVDFSVRSFLTGGYSIGAHETKQRLGRSDVAIIDELRGDQRLANVDEAELTAALARFRVDVMSGRWDRAV
jgi:hypothetical protein